jgi:formylglycine-generating enzyme required for sulfatase activity
MLASGQTDEMVKAGDFWIDRFEMSGSISGGTCGQNTNGVGAGYATGASGKSTSSTTALACSVRGVVPATTTWFQAEQMCANAGKELCTNYKWQTAVNGTPDPGNGVTIPYGGSVMDACNVNHNAGRGSNAGSANSPGNTLAHVDCVSGSGAYDMIGNVWEWTAEWWQAGATVSGFAYGQSTTWPSGYGDGNDLSSNVNGQVSNSGGNGPAVPALPASALRGGGYGDGASAGAFDFNITDAPYAGTPSTGARCCIGG